MPANALGLNRAARTLLVALLPLLALLAYTQADAVVQDPMEAQANSFGWLAIRNFTYCLSDNPDPPNKPRGVQPKQQQSTLAPLGSGTSTPPKQLTGMGDSVVVLYHPENTNKAIAWCNTLVAFQSTEHVQCHVALPTCQRCDAVREKGAGQGQGQGEMGKKNRAPSGRLGQPRTGGSGGSVALHRRDGDGKDPNDPWVAAPGAGGSNAKTQPQTQPQPQQQPQPHPAGIAPSSPAAQPKIPPSRPYDSSTTVDADATTDPELEAAISEFQDYCENKLTLAVRADCPFHIVKSWTDEPPFDLQRFCMTLRGTDGYTLHTPADSNANTDNLGVQESDPSGQQRGGDGGKVRVGAAAGAAGKGGSGNGGVGGDKNGAGASGTDGALDPNDPLVPFPGEGGGKPAAGAPSLSTPKGAK